MIAVLVLLAALLAWQLLVPPVVGLADTADFDRLWRWFGIGTEIKDPDYRYFRYLIREWNIDAGRTESSGFLSSDLLFVAASLPVNALLSPTGIFDIRALGAVRAVALLVVAFLLLSVARRGGTPMVLYVGAVLLLVVADVGYIAYFNSGFTEPGSFIFTLASIALFATLVLDERHRLSWLVCLVVACALLAWTKPQNVVVAIPLAIVVARLATLDPSPPWRTTTLCAALLIVLAALSTRLWPPPLWYTHQIRQIAVFKSILAASPDPAQDLRSLGVDPKFVVLRDKYPWDRESIQLATELQQSFHDRVSDRAIVAFFLRNPDRIVPMLKLSASQALAVRVGVGHFEAASGRPPFTHAGGPAFRSDLVKTFGPHRFRWVVGWLALAVVAAAIVRFTARTKAELLLSEGVIALAVAASLQYSVVALLQGPEAVSKGMMLFALLYDATILSAVGLWVWRVVDGWRSRAAISPSLASAPAR